MIDAAPVSIRLATAKDAVALSSFGRHQFAVTFGPGNAPEDVAAYLATHFHESVQHAELADPLVRVFVAEVEGAWAGYSLASRRGVAPSSVEGTLPWQIERFYVDVAWHGQGLADALMDMTLDAIAREDAQVVWLSVWERNARALAFYARRGFVDVGSTSFLMGRDMQTDRVLTRPVRDRRGVAHPRSTVRRPALMMRLQRGNGGRDLLACVRADGTSSWLRRPGGVPGWERALIAIEATLALPQGVLAQVAAGAELAEFLRPGAAERPDVAGWELRLAAVLDAERSATCPAAAATIRGGLGAVQLRVPLLDEELLLALRGACARLELSWRGLAAGDALEFAVGSTPTEDGFALGRS